MDPLNPSRLIDPLIQKLNEPFVLTFVLRFAGDFGVKPGPVKQPPAFTSPVFWKNEIK